MKLFCPGPVMISDNVRDVMYNCEIGHREPNFITVFIELKTNILKLANADNNYDAVILSASGSAVNEAVVASVFNSDDKVLVLSNGEFGRRVVEMLEVYDIDFDILNCNNGESFDFNKIRDVLTNDNYQYLFVTHQETSYGLLNDIETLGAICKEYNIEFFVDCVSTFGGEDVDVIRQNISIMTSVSGKCIGSTPGASFVVMKKSLFEKCKMNKSQSLYLNLARYYDFSIKKNQTPNTPNIVAFLALNEALKEIIEEKRITRYYELSNYLRDEFIKMNLKFVINRELMSNTVTNIIMPPSISAKQMYESLLAKGYVTYLGKSSDVLQVAVMGNVTKLDCSELIKEMNKIITKKEL